MNLEARIGFILIFFSLWFIVGLLPWTVAAILTRGRGALLALPLALAGAAVAGIIVPLAGQRDVIGFFISLPAAFVGGALASAAGIHFARRPPASENLSDRGDKPGWPTPHGPF